jgi:hypothetical protein
LHGLLISPVYFRGLLQYAIWIVQFNPLPFGGLLLAGGAALFLSHRYRSQLTHTGRWQKPLQALVVILLLAWATYNWFVRPFQPGALAEVGDWVSGGTTPVLDHLNLLRLGWYMSPVGIWLGFAGLGWLIWRWRRDYLPLVGVGLIFSLLYITRIQANPHQVYAMRRYVPAVLPLLLAAAAALLGWLAQQAGWRRLTGLALALLWLGGVAWTSRGFITQIDNRGLLGQFNQLNEQLEPASILIFANPADGFINFGDTVGGPLRFFYGHDVLLLRQQDAYAAADLLTQLEGWLAAGRAVYWIGELPAPYNQLAPTAPGRFTITSQALERSYDHKPTVIVPQQWEFTFYQLEKGVVTD